MSYTRPHHVAEEVSRWPSLGVELPEILTDALATFDTLKWVEVGHSVGFPLSTITTENAEDEIRKYAERLALAEADSGLSMLEKAKARALDHAATSVNHLAGAAAPGIIEQLAPRLEEHAEAYADAVLSLPKDLTFEALVAAGPSSVEIYSRAQHEAGCLTYLRDWLHYLRQLPAHFSQHENVLTILRPDTLEQLLALDQANQGPKPDKVVAAINPVWVTAVRLGVPFALHTPREAVALRRRLESGQPARRPQGVTYMQTA